MRLRFLSLVMKDLRVGGSYSLSRMRPEENLFYSSAEEAAAQQAKLTRRGVRHKPLPDSMRDLPSPEFRVGSSRRLDPTLAFLPFYGFVGEVSRVVVADSAGHTLLYHANEGYAEMLPSTNQWPSGAISLCVTNPRNYICRHALYAINSGTSTNFKSLAYCSDVDDAMAWRWVDLPEPPYVSDGKEDCAIQSHTLLADDSTAGILVLGCTWATA